MRKVGDINFDLEDVMHNLMESNSVSDILGMFYSSLNSKFPDNKEVYLDNSSPTLIYNNKKVKKTKPTKKVNNLINDYSKHDFQWGEIFFIIYGYLHIHFEDVKVMSYR